jgi:hypothetical protein
LFGLQKTLVARYGDILLVSKQELNKGIEALIHSGHDEKNLYVQFRIGERVGSAISPELLVRSAADCKSQLENLYNRTVKGAGSLRRCSDDIENRNLETAMAT